MRTSVNQAIEFEIQDLPESLRDGARNWHLQLSDQQPDGLSAFVDAGGNIRSLVHLVTCSEFAGAVAIRHWHCFCDQCKSGELEKPHDPQLLTSRFESTTDESIGSHSFTRQIRILRNQALLEILWRDLVSECQLGETLTALSNLADCALYAAVEHAGTRHRERFGSIPCDGGPMPLVVLAMGKLGGRELNFSSDIDIVFLYPGDGNSDGPRSLSAHEYFARYARHVVSLLEDLTTDGFVYRVDTRLRPFGASGPPVVSYAALETYLLKHGRDWERYAYIKARIVVPLNNGGAVAGLLSPIIEPFVYRRYLDYGVFESLRDMHELVAVQVRKRNLKDNIKLGPGGIREVEFIVQSLQLVRGGRVAGLRSPELREALKSAVAVRDIDHEVAEKLMHAYEFFRRVENRIQAVRDQQIHELPSSRVERDRLALSMRYPSWDDLNAEIERHRTTVSDQFSAIAKRGNEEQENSAAVSRLTVLWAGAATVEDWCNAIDSLGIEEPRAISEVVVRFFELTTRQKIDSMSADRLRRFVPELLLMLAGRHEPSVTLKRVLRIADKVLRRSAYIALLNENKTALHKLIDLCEKSNYLSEEIGRFPLLLDELLDPELHNRALDARAMSAELDSRLDIVVENDSERQIEVVGRFQRATFFRLAVADLSGNIPIMKVSDRLTDLAEIILIRALAIAYKDLVEQYGEPQYELKGRPHTAGFSVVAYGKLGGMELSYGSDLDLVFLHDSSGDRQHSRGEKSIANGDFFARLARRLVHFLTTQTGSGVLYDIDTRLRPSGRSGLLVTSIEAFERYQEKNAWTWEHQALLRSRAVAGSPAIGRRFERLRVQTLREKVHRDSLAEEVSSMRIKMSKQLDRSNREQFDVKQGGGGIGDIEFLVQYLALANAERHPAVVHYPDNIRQLGTLIAAGLLPEGEGQRLQEIYKIYRLLLHQLALDGKPLMAGQDEFVKERAFVKELWARIIASATDTPGEVGC